ncbi:MAG: GTP cyclohydrolase I FolE [Chloroflexota bacterium]|nr:GTP cyclohydrolase I FolE [Anaerolineae bacterium]HMM29626.1 GTP cyclohydrolase I FolE [Aggregatilineaceae bacterium]
MANSDTRMDNKNNGNRLPQVVEEFANLEFETVDSRAAIEDAVKLILINVGEDPSRDGLRRTPERVARMYEELLEGYQQDLRTILNDALFEVEYGEGEMVVVADIEYQSLCEHHMLPFVGKAHVAYIPRDQVIGLSKIPRIVDMFARRLQVQERLTSEIADAIVEVLDPVGVMVMVEGQHSCASLRGVKKHGVNMVTTAKRGAFSTDRDLRDEFYRLIGR